jgi:hypothetical protein
MIEKRFVQQSERLYQVVLCATLVVALALATGRTDDRASSRQA